MSTGIPPAAEPAAPIAPGAQKYVPTRKVGAGALAGAVSVLVVGALNTWILPADKPIGPSSAAAITTVLTFIVSYFIPEP